MASLDNLTNEKSSVFEDVAYDPDLEARLYAEIYYSNETYERDSPSRVKESTNFATHFKSLTIEPKTSAASSNGTLERKEFDKSDYSRSYYPSRSWVLGETSKDARSGVEQPSVRPRILKQQRLLAQKDLWLPRVESEAQRRLVKVARVNSEDFPSESRLAEAENFEPVLSRSNKVISHSTQFGSRPIEAENFTRIPSRYNEATNASTQFVTESTNFSDAIDLTDDIIRDDCFRTLENSLTARKREEKEKSRKLKLLRKNQLKAKRQLKKLQSRVQRKLRTRSKAFNNEGMTMDTSKYKVVSKKNKFDMKQIESEPVDISSDSDDSILEVPVPPKTPPPVIQLQDSDDDCEKSNKSLSKKHKKAAEEAREESVPSYSLETDSSRDNDSETNVAPVSEINSEDLQNILKEAARKTKDTEIAAAVSSPEVCNLVLNCTEIQKSASSLEELRKIHDTVTLSQAHSDDSMTENEANNWVNIAAGQTNSSRVNEEICQIDPINTELLEQLTQENCTTMAKPSNQIAPSSSEINSPIVIANKTTERDSSVSITNSEVTNSRKRQKDTASSPFKDFDVPAVPEKRVKQNKLKTSREISTNEYFFKPMSKELQAFYNNPWGGENQDLYDIQSRMPKNPNCWTILDADLRSPSRKMRKYCSRCKGTSHFVNKCPEKAKPLCCYMCGAIGHTESRCPHTMCLTCGRKYATYRATCSYCVELYCNMCNGTGHSYKNCPDLWRRYHSTTTETMPVMPRDESNIMKPIHHLTCCNCTKRGHDVTMCRELRWSQHFPTPIFVSSYTQGPMYEPSNRDPIQETSGNNDFTYESSQTEEIHNPESSECPIHRTLDNENPQESNPSENIDMIEIHDVSVPSELLIPWPRGRIVFQAGTINDEETNGWQKKITRLDTIKNIDLNGLLTGNLKPTFLIAWQKYFEFGVGITHDIVDGVYVTIKCMTVTNLKRFEKVIWQWLSRKDAEKAYLTYDELPYDNIDILTQEMRTKLGLLRTVLPPIALLKKIASCDITVKHTSANLKQSFTKKNRRRASALKATSHFSINRRCQLVTSLYSGSWVDGGAKILQLFRKLVNTRLIKMGKKISPNDYLQLIYVYNEIFTFHETAALTEALKKAISASQQSASMNPQTDQLSKDILAYPSAEIIGSLDTIGENDCREITNQRTPEISNFHASTIDEKESKVQEDSLAESLQILTNSDAACNSNTVTESSVESLVPNPLIPYLSQDSDRTSKLKKKKKKNKNKFKSGLLTNFPKAIRKLYLRSAEDIIKIAIGSHVPRLEKIAKALKRNISQGTVHTKDIESLQNAIRDDLRNKSDVNVNLDPQNGGITPFKGTQSQEIANARQLHKQTRVFNAAYVKFLRNL